MGEIDGLRERVEAARRDYAALSLDGWGDLGPADERTGERWDRGHVLGHVVELLPYWTGQVHELLDGSREVLGRDEAGWTRRQTGIEGGRQAGEGGLLGQVDSGLEGVLGLLAGMEDADLDRQVVTSYPDGDLEMDLRATLERLLVGHVEAHLLQLRELGVSPRA